MSNEPLPRRHCTNWLGYEVQYLSPGKGWQSCSYLFNIEAEAIKFMDGLKVYRPLVEFRVYDALS